MFKLMSQMSPSFRQNFDVYDFKSYLQNYRRRNSDDNDVWIDRASMIIPCVSLFALILIVLSSLNVPVRGVHVAIILALIIAMAVYVWKQLDLKIAEQYKREFKQMASQRRRKWVLCSCLCLLGPERKRDQKQVDNHRHRDGKPLVPGFLIEKYRQQACCNQCSAIERNQHKRGQNTVIVDFGMNALDRYHDHRNHEGVLLAVGGWLVINSLLGR